MLWIYGSGEKDCSSCTGHNSVALPMYLHTKYVQCTYCVYIVLQNTSAAIDGIRVRLGTDLVVWVGLKVGSFVRDGSTL